MDRTYIDSHQVIARYLADKLSAEERRSFEEYWAANPEVIRDVEAAANIKVGLGRLDRAGKLGPAIEKPKRVPTFRYLAIAASLIVAVGAAVWLARTDIQAPTLVASLSELADRQGRTPSVQSYSILRTRGAQYDAEIDLTSPPQAIELRVLPEAEASPPTYTVLLERIGDDGSTVKSGELSGLTAGQDGFVSVFFDSTRFTAGRYRLVLSGQGIEASAFRIRLRQGTQ